MLKIIQYIFVLLFIVAQLPVLVFSIISALLYWNWSIADRCADRVIENAICMALGED